MAKSQWSVTGRYLARRGYWQNFTKRCEAEKAEEAREQVLSEIGGNHHVGRHQIRIEKVEAVSA
jgi:ribosomal protein L20A (L18A)